MSMAKVKKREIANVQVRIYKSTAKIIKEVSLDTGKTIARLIAEKFIK